MALLSFGTFGGTKTEGAALMGKAKTIGFRFGLFVLGAIVVANVLHRAVFPSAPPDPVTFPRAGDFFGSRVEGITQEVVAVRDGWVVLRTTVAPGAPGPPMHFHSSFAEDFKVESGQLHVDLPNGVVELGPGDDFRVEPGVPHRPFNATDTEAIVAGGEPAMPQSFAAALVQVYHFLDAAEGQMCPGLMIRIAALDPILDSTMPEIPAFVRFLTDWLVVPFARMFGYKNYYPEFSLHPEGATDGH